MNCAIPAPNIPFRITVCFPHGPRFILRDTRVSSANAACLVVLAKAREFLHWEIPHRKWELQHSGLAFEGLPHSNNHHSSCRLCDYAGVFWKIAMLKPLFFAQSQSTLGIRPKMLNLINVTSENSRTIGLPKSVRKLLTYIDLPDPFFQSGYSPSESHSLFWPSLTANVISSCVTRMMESPSGKNLQFHFRDNKSGMNGS